MPLLALLDVPNSCSSAPDKALRKLRTVPSEALLLRLLMKGNALTSEAETWLKLCFQKEQHGRRWRSRKASKKWNVRSWNAFISIYIYVCVCVGHPWTSLHKYLQPLRMWPCLLSPAMKNRNMPTTCWRGIPKSAKESKLKRRIKSIKHNKSIESGLSHAATWCNLCSRHPLTTGIDPSDTSSMFPASSCLPSTHTASSKAEATSSFGTWLQPLGPAASKGFQRVPTASTTKPWTVLRATWRYWAEAANRSNTYYDDDQLWANYGEIRELWWNTGKCSANRFEWSYINDLGWVKLTEQFWCVLHMLWESDLRWSSLLHPLWRWFLQTARLAKLWDPITNEIADSSYRNLKGPVDFGRWIWTLSSRPPNGMHENIPGWDLE